MAFYVYILASRKNGTLYIGFTNDLVRRADEHRQGAADGFTRQHLVKRLVYFESHERRALRYPTGEDAEALAARMENRAN